MNATPRTPAWYLLTRHWLSLLGAGLAVTAVVSVLFVEPLEVRGHADNPYVGIVLFLILPVFFFSGLGLAALGIYFSRREVRRGLVSSGFDRRSALRRLGLFFAITTAVNIAFGTQFTYRAVHHMETPQFCGATCHTMKPEFAAYKNSPHSRVECVECHVAPGAAGWVSSKASGLRQLVQTVFHTVPQPIPSALESNRLVPARETCENCHWPQKFGGVGLRVYSKFAEDETNTRTETVLLMMIGGNRLSGIHGAHFGPGVRIRFGATDAKRQSIPWVEYRNDTTNETKTYVSPEWAGKGPEGLRTHEMECVDCHNRPTHTFEMPERAVDRALAVGDIPASLPFLKKIGVQLLRTEYPTSEAAAAKIPVSLAAFYREKYPDVHSQRSPEIDRAAKGLVDIYNRNVFPELKVTWGTYPNNLGHSDFPGCFRCHDESHSTADGKTITQDCNRCHQPLAMEETSPEILNTLGIADRISKLQSH